MTNITPRAVHILRKCALNVWDKYDDTHGYATEKKQRVMDHKVNVPEDLWFFLGQFDRNNQIAFMTEVMKIVLTEIMPLCAEKQDTSYVKEINDCLKALKSMLEDGYR